MFVFESYKLVEGIQFSEVLKSMIFSLYFSTVSVKHAMNVLRERFPRSS